MNLELSGQEIVTTLVMEWEFGDERVTLVVEGEEDCALIDAHVEFANAKTQMSGSKTAVLEAAKILQDEGLQWALCIIDADFDHVRGTDRDWPANVVGSVNGDLLVDAIKTDSGKITGAAINLANPGVVQDFEEAVGVSVADWCLERIRPVGAIREGAVDGTFKITARNWPFAGAVAADFRGQFFEYVLESAVTRSGSRHSVEDFRAEVTARLASDPDGSTRYCNGHDFVSLMRELLTHLSAPSLGNHHVAAACRLALSCHGFTQMEVIRRVRAWANFQFSVDPFRCELVS